MNHCSPISGNSQHHTRNQYQMSTQSPAPNSNQDQLQAQNEHLNTQAAYLLNVLLAETRRVVASELGGGMNCTICSESFLRGANLEVPIRLGAQLQLPSRPNILMLRQPRAQSLQARRTFTSSGSRVYWVPGPASVGSSGSIDQCVKSSDSKSNTW